MMTRGIYAEKRSLLAQSFNFSHMSASPRLPSLKLLLGFEAAARLGNYTRAADELCVSPSAISHQIGQLEQQIGQALFRRKGRGVELTIAGQLLHATVLRSIEVMRGGLTRIETYADGNLVTLVCPAAVAHGWLQPRLERLQRLLPALCPIVTVDQSARFVDQLDIDIAITHQPLRQRGIVDRAFLTDARVVVAAPALAAALAAAPRTEHPGHTRVLGLEADLTDERVAPFVRERLGDFARAAIYDDPRLLLDAALRARGIALVSALLAADSIARGRLRVLGGYGSLAQDPLWIARAEHGVRSELVLAVYEHLCAMGDASCTAGSAIAALAPASIGAAPARSKKQRPPEGGLSS
jgi:DNA-binding transcriptional LysR family regulator